MAVTMGTSEAAGWKLVESGFVKGANVDGFYGKGHHYALFTFRDAS